MKILSVGHSMVHPRQQFFFRKLGKLVDESIIVGPRFWTDMGLNDSATKNYSTIGLPVYNAGNIFEYILSGLEETISEIKPDIIYCQAETRARQAYYTMKAAVGRGIPFVLFIWENILHPTTEPEIEIMEKASLIICGNKDAVKLLPETFQEKCRILPQVGIELDIFHPFPDVQLKYDVIYCGRPVPEKGIENINQGCNNLNASLKMLHHEEYLKIPKLLCEGKIFASLPLELPVWKEQSGSYSNLEAMACSLPVITTSTGAIPEYLGDSALYCLPNNTESFIETLKKLLFNKEMREKYTDLGLKKAAEFSNEEISKKLVSYFKEIIK